VAFPAGALLALSYPVWGSFLPGQYGVPLWLCLAETLVLAALLFDAREILQSARAESAAREVCA
jgi:hypothetical protein